MDRPLRRYFDENSISENLAVKRPPSNTPLSNPSGWAQKVKSLLEYYMTLKSMHVTFDFKIIGDYLYMHQSRISFQLLIHFPRVNVPRSCVCFSPAEGDWGTGRVRENPLGRRLVYGPSAEVGAGAGPATGVRANGLRGAGPLPPQQVLGCGQQGQQAADYHYPSSGWAARPRVKFSNLCFQ